MAKYETNCGKKFTLVGWLERSDEYHKLQTALPPSTNSYSSSSRLHELIPLLAPLKNVFSSSRFEVNVIELSGCWRKLFVWEKLLEKARQSLGSKKLLWERKKESFQMMCECGCGGKSPTRMRRVWRDASQMPHDTTLATTKKRSSFLFN